MNLFFSYWPVLFLAAGLGLGLWAIHWFLIGRDPDLGNERKFPRQITMLALSLLSLVALILALPIPEGSRNKLLGLIGLIVSALVAFSSANILANLMGGVLLRITKPFRIGDFVRIGEHFGRVAERGLFDTEIQTESRELIALPNAYLINHPITTIRSSGAIVSTTLSLGYEVHHGTAEALLLSAAEQCGLEEPFVHIIELGNFSVCYRLSGLLTDTKRLITAKSDLCRSVLDTLHGQGIEIMSPAYMNQRPLGEASTTIPKAIITRTTADSEGVEDLVFDKAEEAERREEQKQQVIKEIQNLDASLGEAVDDDKILIKKKLESARERLKAIEESEVKSPLEDDVSKSSPAGDADRPRA